MKKILVSLFFAMVFVSSGWAEVLVFIHGYDSYSNTWRDKGLFSVMHSQGWQDAGNLLSTPGGIIYQQPKELKPFRMVTVDLPSNAPVQVQADILAAYIRKLQVNDANQLFTFIGHSAGGLVARYAIVRYPELPVKRLITIASPHLGTGMAEVAELAADTPVAMIAPVLGADIINHSDILLDQMQREEPGSFLFWLNRQKHPEINYFSIVRSHGSLFNKDYYVPSYSQDLRHVPGVRFATTFPSFGKHELQYKDAFLIAHLVNQPLR